MRHIQDPFPPTPEGFRLRVDQTLLSLDARAPRRRAARRRALVLAAAILAALLAATAVAAIAGRSGLKDRLTEEGVEEVAALVQEAHVAAPGAEDGFAFSVDEILWEDTYLYISYSLSVPDDGQYMVAMYTPTLNGAPLQYDAKGFTAPKFFDGEDGGSAVLLLGGRHESACDELWTFAADPALKGRRDNRLRFRAVLLRTDLDLEGGGDWTDVLRPPKYEVFLPDWRDRLPAAEAAALDGAYAALLDAVDAARDGDGALSLEAFIAASGAEYVAQREIDLDLDASRLPQALYNDVAERDFDLPGVHLRVDGFRLTHLGADIRLTLSTPGVTGAQGGAARLGALLDLDWRFGTPDGQPLGFTLGADGGASWAPLEDGSAAYAVRWRDHAILPLEGLERIIYAPVTFEEDAKGNQLPPVYDMDMAIVLPPIYSEAIARLEAEATPEPTLSLDEAEAWLEAGLSG